MTLRMIQKTFFTITLFSAFLIALSPSLKATTRISVSGATVKPIPIHIQNFTDTNTSQEGFGPNIAYLIRNNLGNSARFKVSAYDPAPSYGSQSNNPIYSVWQDRNIQAYVSGSVTKTSGNRLKVEFKLWDMDTEKQLFGISYYSEVSNWRRVGHIISDKIYHLLTGEAGYFDTRIVYISQAGKKNNLKRLAIMDQDGANHKFLTNGTQLVATPRFSRTEQEIAYVSFTNKKSKIYVYNLTTGQQTLLTNFPGLAFAPRFSPDGQSLIFSMATEGNTDIYIINKKTARLQRITTNPSIDTAPSYSPDGGSITFESDRSGEQEIYVKNLASGQVKRISFGSGRYATPVWSPKSDHIAFTKMYRGKFYIGLMNADGSGEKILSESFHVEGPSWSPNGNYIVYFKEFASSRRGNGKARLYASDILGLQEREIVTPGEGVDPSWSPTLP